MSLIDAANKRRNDILKNLIKEQVQHSLVHINFMKLAKKYNVNRNAIANDINFFLKNNMLEWFLPNAQVYKLVGDKKTINNEYLPPAEIKPKIEAEAEPKKINVANKKQSDKDLDFSLINVDFFNELEIKSIHDFVAHRQQIKEPFTKIGFSAFINKAKKFKEKKYCLIQCVEDAIVGSWKSIYPPKNYNNNNVNIRQMTYKEIDEHNRIDALRRDREAMNIANNAVESISDKWANKYKNNINGENENDNGNLLTSTYKNS